MLIVSAGVSVGRPAADRRLPRGRLAGPGLQHLAHDHVLGLVGSIPARSSAARIAIAPSSVAACSARPPPSFPNGVRTALTITLRVMRRR